MTLYDEPREDGILHCTVSGIVKHGDQGYGFKLTFLDEVTARHQKEVMVSYLESLGFIVTVRKSYFDGGKEE